MKNKLKGVLFDMDGTVLDSEGLFDNAQLSLLKEYNIKSSTNELSDFKGMSYKDFYPQFMKKFNLVDDIEVIRSKLRTYLHDIMEKNLNFIDGFKDFYNSSIKNKNLKIGLVTNTTRLTFKKIQTFINIDDYFSYVLTSTEAKEPKPSPMPYLQAMEFLSLNPNQTLIIEDSKTGLLSGIKSNAIVFGLTTSLTEDQIKKISNNIRIANSYTDIEVFLKNYNGQK
tara:strand:+ start:256 stop:930 length:675 start_codon:yes stop_codon:yes gene_type:complete